MKEQMKDSGIEWIGKVPSSWELIRMKDCSYMKGRIGWQGLTANEFIEEGPFLITGTDFENGRVIWDRCYHISEKRYEKAKPIQVEVNDLLVTKDGTIGKLAFIDSLPGKASLNSHLLVIRPLENKYINQYLFWVLSSSIFKGYYSLVSYGSTMDSLSQEKVGEFKFYIPCINEQKVIADYLDEKCSKLDEIIADLEKQIELLENYRLSIITETMTKGLNKNIDLKESNTPFVNKIPNHWEDKRIKYLIEGIKDGTHGSFDRVDDGELLLSAKNVFNDGIHITDNESMISKKDYKSIVSNGYPKKGDVLLSCVGTVGRTCVYDFDYPIAFQRSTIFLRPLKEINSFYLSYALQSLPMLIQEKNLINKSAQEGLYMGAVKELYIPITYDMSEQLQIVEYLSNVLKTIDEKIVLKNKSLEYIKRYKSSLIYEYVTGKKRVKVGE